MPIAPSALFNRDRGTCPAKCGACKKRCPAHLDIDGDTPVSYTHLEMLANIKNQTTYGVEEQIGHLREALNMLVKAPAPTATPAQPTATPAPAQPTATPVPAQPTATPAPAQPTVTPSPTVAPAKGITATAKASTIYTKGKTSTTITVVKNDVTGKVKFTSSNKKVATRCV